MLRLFSLFILLCGFYQITFATTIGLHGIQHSSTQTLLEREQQQQTQIPIIGIIFDSYGPDQQEYLAGLVAELGTERIYHISLSPRGYTAAQVVAGQYDTEYNQFFQDIKKLNIKIVFRTMHEMNGGRYSRASQPHDFKQARQHVRHLARIRHKIASDKLLFSLSFNSQDLPTTDSVPHHHSPIEYCNERRIRNRGRCPRKIDYYPGDRYVDLVGVTLYNRGRSRADSRSKRKSPQTLLTEENLWGQLNQRNKPIIIDELGTTAINFEGTRSADKARQVFEQENRHKNKRIRELISLLPQYPNIIALVYFNIDITQGAKESVIGQAERPIVMSPYQDDYRQGIKLLLHHNTHDLQKLFERNHLQITKKTKKESQLRPSGRRAR